MNRTALINYLLGQRSGTRYLEIGVCDESLNLAHIDCPRKVGVDVLPVSTFHGTSDAFFAANGGQFDVVLIDGLHTEEQAARDIANAYGCLAPGGALVLHDCLPPDAWHQRPAEEYADGESWNGSVWKAALREFNRTDHWCAVLDTDWGLGVIDTARRQAPAGDELPEELDYERDFGRLLAYRMSVAEYLRDRVAVFYHLACIGSWRDVLAEQLQVLSRNGFRSLRLSALGSRADLDAALLACGEHSMQVEVIAHDEAPQRFETPALLAVEAHASAHDGHVLYLHSKGVSSPGDESKARWRRLMMCELVDGWERCVIELPYYDAIGVNWRDMPPISHFSGNFWYASTAYLRRLADFRSYYESPRHQMREADTDRRLGCEFWIGSGPRAPHVLSLVTRNEDFCAPGYWNVEH